MIKQTVVYQIVTELNQLLTDLQIKVNTLPEGRDLSEDLWEEVDSQLTKIDEQMMSLKNQERLNPEDFSEIEWLNWRELVEDTQHSYQKVLAQLIHKKEVFYQDTRSVGKSVKANQAYNNMKRIRF